MIVRHGYQVSLDSMAKSRGWIFTGTMDLNKRMTENIVEKWRRIIKPTDDNKCKLVNMHGKWRECKKLNTEHKVEDVRKLHPWNIKGSRTWKYTKFKRVANISVGMLGEQNAVSSCQTNCLWLVSLSWTQQLTKPATNSSLPTKGCRLHAFKNYTYIKMKIEI